MGEKKLHQPLHNEDVHNNDELTPDFLEFTLNTLKSQTLGANFPIEGVKSHLMIILGGQNEAEKIFASTNPVHTLPAKVIPEYDCINRRFKRA